MYVDTFGCVRCMIPFDITKLNVRSLNRSECYDMKVHYVGELHIETVVYLNVFVVYQQAKTWK